MKQLILSCAVIALLGTTAGCANGPIGRFFFRGSECDVCQPPAAAPSYGPGCAGGACQTQGASYLNDSFIQGDPYLNGSNLGGATINPPVFDTFGSPNAGGTIVSPGSSGELSGPANGR